MVYKVPLGYRFLFCGLPFEACLIRTVVWNFKSLEIRLTGVKSQLGHSVAVGLKWLVCTRDRLNIKYGNTFP